MSSITSILSNASSGLRASQTGIAVLSDNIANAGVAGYTSKTLDLSTLDVSGQADGVLTGTISRSVDSAVQASVLTSASAVGALTVRSQILNAINQTQGAPGAGTSLADTVSALQTSFIELQSQPSNTTQQSTVVAAASTLAQTINSTATAITAQRNDAQSQIVSAVSTLNNALATVASTTHAIIIAKAANGDTANLEDQRDQSLNTLSGLLNLSYDRQPNGNLTILGQGGLSIPLDSTFSTSGAVLPASSTSAPAILLQSSNPTIPAVDVTAQLTGGQLGELIQQRDTVLPAYTSGLDALSAKLANQFSAQGLQLFTDGSGAATLTAYQGLSSQITVNPAVLATPALVRDGTATGASALNPSAASGFTGLIDSVLGTTFAATATTTSIGTDAQNFVTRQSTSTAQATADLTSATSYQAAVGSQFSSQSSVNVDQQLGLMIQLQNSYQANARVIQAVQSMFATLVSATLTTGA